MANSQLLQTLTEPALIGQRAVETFTTYRADQAFDEGMFSRCA